MRIGLDATAWSGGRGPGRAARNLVRSMTELGGDEYVILADARDHASIELSGAARIRPVALGGSRRSRTARPPADLVRLIRAARSLELDVLVFPSTSTWFPLAGTPTVVGAYDAIAQRMPEAHFDNRRAAIALTLKERAATRAASRVFTISQAARREVADHFGLDPARLAVVPFAPDPALAPRGADEVARRLAELGLRPGRYVLYSGGFNPRKNLETLIDAHARLADRGVPLVLVGEPKGRAYDRDLRERAEASAGEVVVTGFVPDDMLACLYSGAAVFVTTSLAEGFGLPAVEAARCGAAVVATDIPAHRENLGEAGVFFEPGSVADLTRALGALLGDDDERRARGDAAQRAVAGLSWHEAAVRLRAVAADAARAAPSPRAGRR
jgi:glycosyltransferase involved in cell wall biosynthesis